MSCCHSCTDCLPPFFLLLIMEWSYYVYIVEICINIIQKNNLLKEVIYLGIFNLIFIMWAWSFVKTKYNDVAVVPTEFKIPLQLYQLIQNAESEEEKNQLLIEYCVIMHLPIYTRNQNGSIRYPNLFINIIIFNRNL